MQIHSILYATFRGVARDKSMCRHHCSKGGSGGMPPPILISYIAAAAFWDIFKACFEGNNFKFEHVCQA